MKISLLLVAAEIAESAKRFDATAAELVRP
jgi:hypothetical protein